MKKCCLILLFPFLSLPGYTWGFYAHKKINFLAVFLLPPEMILFYKQHIDFISDHAVDPDKRRYAVKQEAPRHYIDIDHYGPWPYPDLPRNWKEAQKRYSTDSLNAFGIVPWWIQTMLWRLTEAFKSRDQSAILKLSAEIGHYIADSHVPLHTNSNHNGQLTSQVGIHAFWESRIPELLAETEWNFMIGKAIYLNDPGSFIWERVLESGQEADTVLRKEKMLSLLFAPDRKFSFEQRNGRIVRQYSSAYARAYNLLLEGMVERRMRQSIFAVASFWYTAWVNAGQPDLAKLVHREFSLAEQKEFEKLNAAWKGEECH